MSEACGNALDSLSIVDLDPIRRCQKCCRDLSVSEYGKSFYCRQCNAEYCRKWRKTNRELWNEYTRNWDHRKRGLSDEQKERLEMRREERATCIDCGCVSGRRLRCDDCDRRMFMNRYAKDAEFREAHREKTRRWRQLNPDKAAAIDQRKREQRSKKDKGLGELVYFIQANSGGPIKVGYTQKNPRTRLIGLNISYWEEFRILGIQCGGRRLESDLHYCFKHLLLRGEWYRAEEELLSYIRDNAHSWDEVSRVWAIAVEAEINKENQIIISYRPQERHAQSLVQPAYSKGAPGLSTQI